jgi:leucyl-tRNA---protein transferase
VARLVRHFIEESRPCSYLLAAKASLEYRLMVDVTAEELEKLLLRGWRRFGPAYFRPACNPCTECQSIRLDVHQFRASTSQTRALKRSRRFEIRLGTPTVDAERIELHARWHDTREKARGWDETRLEEDEYATQFAFPSTTGREMAWYLDGALVAIGLIDVTVNALSAAYFFYHPSIARLSPGVGNVMRCIELARELGCLYVYLGYRVEACSSLTYKGLFRPHEILKGRPGLNEIPVWLNAVNRAS